MLRSHRTGNTEQGSHQQDRWEDRTSLAWEDAGELDGRGLRINHAPAFPRLDGESCC